MTVNDISDENFIKFVSESKTWSELLIKCGYNNVGNRNVVKKRIDKLKIDATHLPTGQNWAAGAKIQKKSYTMDEILVVDSEYKNMSKLKKRLKSEMKWEHRCNNCKLTEWMGKPIPLEIEHKNGIHNDNRIENLEFLCPNCHAFTETYRGKNAKAYKEVNKIDTKCIDCGTNVTSGSSRCEECNHKEMRTVERPSYEQLMDDKKIMSMLAIGKKYSVTDNTIRKWIKKYEKDLNISTSK